MRQLRHMRTAQILKEAREIVATRWDKNNYVTDSKGKDKTDLDRQFGIPDDDDDYSYCGDGAMRRAVKNAIKHWDEIKKGSQAESVLYEAQKALAKPIAKRLTTEQITGKRSHQLMWCFNDLPTTTKEDILAVYDEAIEEACKVVQDEARIHEGDEAKGVD